MIYVEQIPNKLVYVLNLLLCVQNYDSDWQQFKHFDPLLPRERHVLVGEAAVELRLDAMPRPLAARYALGDGEVALTLQVVALPLPLALLQLQLLQRGGLLLLGQLWAEQLVGLLDEQRE